MPIFREYIGVKPNPDTLNDFPGDIINPRIHFHFILGFATDANDQQGRGTGNFNPNWNADYFSPENVERLKEEYPNVKVVISIGGREPEYRFNPAENGAWVNNAIASLQEIIENYNIDGIDIHYEHIDHNAIPDFASCMGKVIVGLKGKVPAINVVSIAPSGHPLDRVASCYKRLYQLYRRHINWVDYQFYSQAVPSVDVFVDLYRNQVFNHFFDGSQRDASKLLVGGSTDPADAANMPREVFIEGVWYLVQNASLSGAFVWNANDSAAHPHPFFLEETIQAILTAPPAGPEQ